jgi:hypothetical protein
MTALLRPFTVGELLDGAFSLYRRNFSSLFAIALVPQIPLILLWLVLPTFAAGDNAQATVGAASLLSLPYSLAAAAAIWAGLVFASMRAFEGGTFSASDALKVAMRTLPAVIVATIVAVLLITLGMFLLIVPGLIIASMFFAIVPAIVIEGYGPFASLGRSRRLSKGARLRIFGVLVLATLIAALPVIAFSMIAGVAAATGAARGVASATLSVGWQAVVQAGSLVLGALTTPYSVAALTLLYVDRRARTEAPDLEEAASRLSGV